MSSTVDLHMHSTASDGTLPVDDLIKLCSSVGLKTVALTDHDTTAALDRAQEIGKALGLEIIPGIELSAEYAGKEVHVLGYFIEYHDATFQSQLERFRYNRYGRAQAILAKLADLGMPLDWERVLQIAGDAAPQRPHIAEALKERGYVETVREAFDRYISNDGPAYVHSEKVTPEQAVELIRSVGGLAVLAHPTYVKNVEEVLEITAKAGLSGVETYYGLYSDETVANIEKYSRQYDLVPTGGSDFHGRLDGGQLTSPGARYVPPEVIDQLKQRLSR
ncbi:MAG TPA: PHP domain-containing protein [Chloroflexia bacterium]|nr:PHP domain-containing protein [Chloroflexia bacterium]